MIEVITKKPQQTFNLGKEFSQKLKVGDIVAFYGELGTGKTHFIKGICKGLGVKNNVISPSYSIINEYSGDTKVYHIDFYRIENIDDIRELGIEEYLYDDGVCLIEWADRVDFLLPEERVSIKLDFSEENNNWRRVRIEE